MKGSRRHRSTWVAATRYSVARDRACVRRATIASFLNFVAAFVLLRDQIIDFLDRCKFFLRREHMLVPVLDCACIGITERLGALEDRCQCVVITLRDGVELVIVTADTAERHPHQPLAGGVDLLVDRIHLELLAIGLRNASPRAPRTRSPFWFLHQRRATDHRLAARRRIDRTVCPD